MSNLNVEIVLFCVFSEARSVGTTTDDFINSEIHQRNRVPHSETMHDAQLLSNSEVTQDGQRVTDLIIEIRDDCKQRHHFMPCPRNTKGILVYVKSGPRKYLVKLFVCGTFFVRTKSLAEF